MAGKSVTFTATNGPASGIASNDIGVSEASNSWLGHSLQLKGSGSNYEDFAWSSVSEASFGSVQHVEAVVSTDFQGSGNLNGFFVQQGNDSDANPATSEGLFVTASTPVNVGDRVHIVGTVAEPFGMTRLDSVTSVEVWDLVDSVQILNTSNSRTPSTLRKATLP